VKKIIGNAPPQPFIKKENIFDNKVYCAVLKYPYSPAVWSMKYYSGITHNPSMRGIREVASLEPLRSG
jgi:hypothetical protein